MQPQHDGTRTETRTRFIEGEGHLVEEVVVGTPVAAGQSVLPAAPPQPGQPVIVTLADVPLSLAKQVCKANGLIAVPESYLNEQQLAELGLDPELIKTIGEIMDVANEGTKAKPMTEAQAIKAVKEAATYEELNTLTNVYTSAKVLSAAEVRAAELKGN
jgi:hypothetical protein